MDIFIQLLTALLGSLGFALLFQLRNRLLLAASIGGLLNWAVYLFISQFTKGGFVAYFVAAAAAVIYCEIAARTLKAPVTLFLVPSVVPSVPGSGLYYTMSSIARKDWDSTKDFGIKTAEYALGIAAGICLAVVLFSIVNSIVRHSHKE